ncbi:MAG: molecular chaperone GrpE [Planctomycetota bacterium]|jgi:molecular chaperone GrpE
MIKKKDQQEEIEEEIIIDDLESEDHGDEISKVTKLKAELKTCKSERQEYLDGWQRSRAEFANAQTGQVENQKHTREYAQDDLIIAVLPVLDSFDMAMKNKEAWEAVDENWRVGIEYIKQQFLQILSEYNLSVISTVGIPFDKHIHEPLEITPVEKPEEDDQVLTIIQNGYQRGDKILRPAKVSIGKLIS